MPKRAILWIAVSSGQQADEEKDSLPEQERRLREISSERDWQIVDMITVPGHSRVYYNYPEFAAAALQEDISGPARMLEHWARRDFDIFACIAGDRFGRAASIFNEVVERTYDAGAQVFTMRDGLIERGNEGTWAVMASYAASSEVKELRRRHIFGMNKRAEKGLPVSPRIVFSHKVVRDEIGRAQKIAVKDEYRQLFADVAKVLLDRTPWYAVERVLYERYGHVAANGKPYHTTFFYRILNSPVFWGNNARYYADGRSEHSRQIGGWMFDSGDPAPEGVLIYYNTHEPMYSDDLATSVKAELRRRLELSGSSRPNSIYAFSRLLECRACGHGMSWLTGRNNLRRARCNVAYGLLPRWQRACSERRHISERYAVEYMKTLIALVVEAADVSALLSTLAEVQAPVDETPMLIKEIETLEEQGRVLIQKQMTARGSTSKLYDEQMDILGERIELLTARLQAAQHRQPTPFDLHDQRSAVDDMRALGARFWELPPGEINQYLHRALRGHKLLVTAGKITGLKYVR